MKRILALLLALCLFLPALSFAELDEEDIAFEDEDLDEDIEESEPENTDAEPLSEDLQNELVSSMESSEYVPTELDNDNLFINENLPTEDIINILLVGVDTRNAELIENDVKLADVQMILSVNTATGSVATVNYNFEMNIQYYMTINFRGVAAIIDAIGGIDLELSEGEAWNINKYLSKNAKSISKHYDTAEAKAARVKLEVRDGVQHLDGLQALMYARLRKSLSKKYQMGDDWQRTARARNLLDKLLQKVLKKDFWDLLDLVSIGIEHVNSNMNADFIGSLIWNLLQSGIVSKVGSSDSIIEQFRIPMGDPSDGSKTWNYDSDSGKIFMSKRNGNFQKNVEALHEFIYGRYYPANP